MGYNYYRGWNEQKGKDAPHLEQLERDRILREWAVQGEGGDSWVRRHRVKKGFADVERREEPPGRACVPLGSSESNVKCVDEHTMGGPELQGHLS